MEQEGVCLAVCPTQVLPSLGPRAVSHLCLALSAGSAALGTPLGTVSLHTTTARLCCVTPATVHSPVCPFPCSAMQESRGFICTVTSSFLGDTTTDPMEESLGYGRIHSGLCADSCIPPSQWHVTLLSPSQTWQLPMKALTVSLKSPSSTIVFLVLLW